MDNRGRLISRRVWMRVISLILIGIILINDCLGGREIVLAVQSQPDTELTENPDGVTMPEQNEGEVTDEITGGKTDQVIDETIDESAEELTEEKPQESLSGQDTEETDSKEDSDLPDTGLLPGDENSSVESEGEEIQEDESDFLADDEPQNVLISEEDITKRSSNIKYFLNEDHSYTAAVYSNPVHYEENGEWKEINNQLENAETEEGAEYLGNKQNPFSVKFAKKSNGKKLVKLKLGEFQVSWGLKDAQKTDVQQAELIQSKSAGESHHDEAPADIVEEDSASIFTECPDAAQIQTRGITDVEEKFGKILGKLPENNSEEGVLPEEQQIWQNTNDTEEETLDAKYYDSIEETNQEKMKVDNLSSGVVYEEILPQVDLEYLIESQRLKENIILKSSDAPNEFTFQFQVNGLELIQEGKEIYFKDGADKTIFVLQAPYLYDGAGTYSDNIELELTQGKGKKSEIKLIVDEEWLYDEERIFPVVIDPAVQTDQDATAIQDTYVLSGYPTSNYYLRDVLKTGVDGAAGVARSYMKFNLPPLKSGDMVIDATLNLYCYTNSTSATTIAAHEVFDSNWTSSGITWQTAPTYNENKADYVTFTPQNGKKIDLSITSLVKSWYEQGECSGIMLRTAKEDGQYTEYVSSDFSLQYKDCRPSVIISYINNNGLEDYWSYHDQSVGRAGTGYVNDYNGNLIFIHDTASTNENRMPIALTHVYNTNDKDINLGYGYGWRLNYLQTVKSVKISNIDYYEYVDEDGTYHHFYYDQDKKQWKDDSGIDMELTVNSSNTEKYVIKDKQDCKLFFDSSGKLVKISDQNGNTAVVSYTGNKISKIQSGGGSTVTCTYNSNGLLTEIKNSSTGTKKFSYQNNLLDKITDIDSKIVQYTYNSARALTSAVNIDGYKVQYTYTQQDPYRIQKVEEKAGDAPGQSFEIWRYSNQSRFTDWKGRVETYLFNNSGNTVSIKNDQGDAQTAKYLTEGVNKNKISKVTKLQTPSVNLLESPYLNSMSGWGKVQDKATANLTADKSKALEGNNVMHLVSSQKSGKAGIKQSVTLKGGITYTFSAYVQAKESDIGQGKCDVRIKAVTDKDKTLYSDELDYYKTENGWYRLITSITIPNGIVIKQGEVYAGITGIADVYYDCFQLEESASASRFNLINNGDFRRKETGYTKTGTNAYDRTVDSSNLDHTMTVKYRMGTVNYPEVNLRSGPGTNYGIVSSANSGTLVTAIGEGTDANGVTWYYTYLIKDKQVYSGYMISQYISFSNGYAYTATTGIVDIENLNVRKGPGTSYAILTTIPRNTVVQSVGGAASSNGQLWNLVTFSISGTRYTGYVLGEYIYDTRLETVIEPMKTASLDSNIFYMTGNPSFVKKLTQTLNISGKAGDVFMGNLWGCGLPVEQKDSRTFGLEVEFFAADGTTESYVSNFKANTSFWQFLNDIFIPKKDYVKVNVSCIYNYNGNVVAFDGLAFFREDFAESYIYDTEGNIISVQDNAKNKSSFEYDSNNNLKKITDPKGNSFQYTYDTSHNVTSAVSAENMKYTFQYDQYGNPTEAKIVNVQNENEYISSKAAYTPDGNYLSSIQDPLGNQVIYHYNTVKGLLMSCEDAKEQVTSYEYDTMGHLTSVSKTRVQGETDDEIEVSYSYENDVLKQINWNDFSYVFQKDGFGNSTGVMAVGRQLVSQTYEGNNGNLISEQYANGYTYLYKYDNKDRVTEISLKDASGKEYVLYRYQYDKEGNLAVEYDIREDIGKDTIVTRYFYDISGRLVYFRNDRDEDYRFVYDENDNLIKSVQGNQFRALQEEYTYDKDSRETNTKTAEKNYQTVYDALGRISSRTWDTAQPYVTQYIYHAGTEGSQSCQVEKVNSGGEETVYKYDENGNITEIETEDNTIRYEYDELGQLIREDNSILNETLYYVYDKGGNLLKKRHFSYRPDSGTESLDEIMPGEEDVSYTYDSQWKDLLVSYDGQEITYDAIGNPLQYKGMNFTWKNGKELTQVEKNGQSTTYRYNKDGIRNRKYMADGTVLYQLQGNTITGEQKIDAETGKPIYELEFLYDSVGNVLSMVYNGIEYYYVKNLQGDITGIIDGQGTTVASYQYDSWGVLLEIEGNQEIGKANPFRYRGYYYDAETGLYYVSSRYYDPEICRFINADDTDFLTAEHQNFIQYNLYAYCWNNPVNMSDENGDWPGWATKVVIGVVAIAIGAAAVALTGGGAVAILSTVVSSLKVATTSAAISAGTNVISNRVLTGSWKGSGKALLNGATDGFMWGGITAGVTAVALASKGVYVNKIGNLKPTNKYSNGYAGVRYGVKKSSGNLSYRSIELHSPHTGGKHNVWHWQQNRWSYNKDNNIWSISSKKARHWNIWGRRL